MPSIVTCSPGGGGGPDADGFQQRASGGLTLVNSNSNSNRNSNSYDSKKTKK